MIDLTNVMYFILLYGMVYLLFIKLLDDKYVWDVFTRVISTINSIQCLFIVLSTLWDYDNYYNHLNYVGSPYLTNGLYWFSTYLFVDVAFMLPQSIQNFTVSEFTSVAHHLVGGLGIYLIASQSIALGLGMYFALTEISTPLLNLSWFLYVNKIKNEMSKWVFVGFYVMFGVARIVTIPLLLGYIRYHKDAINQMNLLNYCMIYGGSWTLMGLNCIWFAMLTIKLKSLLRPHRKILSYSAIVKHNHY